MLIVYPNEICHIFCIIEGELLRKQRLSPRSTIFKKAQANHQGKMALKLYLKEIPISSLQKCVSLSLVDVFIAICKF